MRLEAFEVVEMCELRDCQSDHSNIVHNINTIPLIIGKARRYDSPELYRRIMDSLMVD